MPTLLAAHVADRYSPPTDPTFAIDPALAHLCRDETPQTDAELRDAIGAFVHRSRERGLPPERVIVALKRAMVKSWGLHAMPSLVCQPLLFIDGESPILAYRRVFTLFIDAYYETA